MAATLTAESTALLLDVVARLERIENLLLARTRPRDEWDRSLIVILGESAQGLPFQTKAAMKRAEADPVLERALRDADISSAKQLGRLLERFDGQTIEHVRIERVGDRRGGILWRLHVLHVQGHDTCNGGRWKAQRLTPR